MPAIPPPPPANLTLGGYVNKDCGCFNASPAPGCFVDLAFPLRVPTREITMYVKDSRGGIFSFTTFTDADGLFVVPYDTFPIGFIGGTAKALEFWFVLKGQPVEKRIILTDGIKPFDCLLLTFYLCGETTYNRIEFSINIANVACFPPRGLKEQILTISGLVLPDTELLIFNSPTAPIVAELPPSAGWGLYPGRLIYFKDVSGATAVNYQRILAAPFKIDTLDYYVDMSIIPNDRQGRILAFSATFGWQNF